jgi:hypothetical protein
MQLDKSLEEKSFRNGDGGHPNTNTPSPELRRATPALDKTAHPKTKSLEDAVTKERNMPS